MEDYLLAWHDWRLPLLAVTLIVLAATRIWRLLPQQEPIQSLHVEDTQISNFVEKKEATHESLQDTKITAHETTSNIQPFNNPGINLPPKTSSVPPTPRRIVGRKPFVKKLSSSSINTQVQPIQPLIFFSSLSGSTEESARTFTESFQASINSLPNISLPQLLDLTSIDHDDYFTSLPKVSPGARQPRYFYILLVPTYNIDTYLDLFLSHLQETHHDFRIDTAPLSEMLGYSVFGFGDKLGWPTEEQGFCTQAREVDKWMAKLSGRKRAYPLGMGDVSGDAVQRLDDWRRGLLEVLGDLAAGKTLGEGVVGSGDPVESEDEEEDIETQDTKSPRRKKQSPAEVNDDMENLGAGIELSANTTSSKTPLTIDFTTYNSSSNPPPQQSAPKEMVPKTSPTYTALTKQGYTIVGSHSGVKICRWTKSALRGRGSCYKFPFYGIKSHLCMETTPSLSCSNKCVFCWRHGTNPVGTTWRWQIDPPEAIFHGVKEGHYKKIKMMRGVPGVRAERFEEAMRIRHCALSLVGEPIFYPYINEFLAMLHAERISSFLVCNAQHPAELAALKTVTQLYVSSDASNRDSLRKIDRPLHRDFWERLLACLDILKQRRHRQRTVFRLTLVKGFNIADEAEGYAELIARGLPCFVEVKGVTYCGTSTSAGAGLTMQNVPFYSEVCDFVRELEAALKRRGLAYGIAAEHAHSCCVLIGSERFLKDGVWHTVIDYEKFFELLESGSEFGPEEYMSPTEEWAWWGNGGFDPKDERVIRRRGKIVGVVGGDDGSVED